MTDPLSRPAVLVVSADAPWGAAAVHAPFGAARVFTGAGIGNVVVAGPSER
jgi:hypothetical protein